ncbi:macro domain-containing protein CT2219-like isoform X2 [Phymastichus coffea]|uniref:macro domain-containing protein CT2219-like isoform X2 n=1 Tax=Phymastichus coffea TaxID=108790 RepID=UPI00273B91F4|nr:macro domain-containing protein CT2219-like isoform X2 [Phymastichus coffea]XP_058788888.1 macro domain-containing protein CT2219-like isoform X2 [Phymastichus coffea]
MLCLKILQTFTSVQESLQTASCHRAFRAVENFFANKATTKGNMSFEAEKQKYLSMSAVDKRKILKSEPTTVDQILTWPEYWNKNKTNIGVLKLEEPEKPNKELASKISIWEGDITKLEIDAIVNAANSSLLGGGGVDGAIHRTAGAHLKEECATLGGCHVGEAKITGGYMLPAKHVIHTVGPQGEKPEKLTDCYKNSLTIAKQNGLRTIAFPCISTGIYGYPQRPAAKVALSSVRKFLLDNPDSMDRVIFCLFLKTDKDIYEELLQKYFAFE